jgi:hypothetical protein
VTLPIQVVEFRRAILDAVADKHFEFIDGVESSEQPRSVIPGKLAHFGLPRFVLGDDGRVRQR